MKESIALDAVLAAVAANPEASQDELFNIALGYADVADRFDYVLRIRTTTEQNIHETFPEWAGNDWNVRTLTVEKVAKAVSNNGATYDKAEVAFVMPPNWDAERSNKVPTGWLSQGSWQPKYIANTAHRATGTVCRFYWRTFDIPDGNGRRARELVWIEPLGPSQVKQQAQPAERQTEPPRDPNSNPQGQQTHDRNSNPQPPTNNRPPEVAAPQPTPPQQMRQALAQSAPSPAPQPEPPAPSSAPQVQRDNGSAAALAAFDTLAPELKKDVERWMGAEGIPPLPACTPEQVTRFHEQVMLLLGEEPF